jgi:hypothetical protein
MPMDNIARLNVDAGAIYLTHNLYNVSSAKLDLSQFEGGFFAVFGRVVIENLDSSSQPAGAVLKTQKFTLDSVEFILSPRGEGGSSMVAALQATLFWESADQLLEVIGGTYNGVARSGSLMAISVDGLSA